LQQPSLGGEGLFLLASAQAILNSVGEATVVRRVGRAERDEGRQVTSVAISRDDQRIVSGSGELRKPGEVKVWDAPPTDDQALPRAPRR
jgi:hypothetical protein